MQPGRNGVSHRVTRVTGPVCHRKVTDGPGLVALGISRASPEGIWAAKSMYEHKHKFCSARGFAVESAHPPLLTQHQISWLKLQVCWVKLQISQIRRQNVRPQRWHLASPGSYTLRAVVTARCTRASRGTYSCALEHTTPDAGRATHAAVAHLRCARSAAAPPRATRYGWNGP